MHLVLLALIVYYSSYDWRTGKFAKAPRYSRLPRKGGWWQRKTVIFPIKLINKGPASRLVAFTSLMIVPALRLFLHRAHDSRIVMTIIDSTPTSIGAVPRCGDLSAEPPFPSLGGGRRESERPEQLQADVARASSTFAH